MNPYEVLGVPKDADAKTIRKRYHERALELRPDMNDTPECRALIEAYSILSDENKRAAYDQYGNPNPIESDTIRLFMSLFENISSQLLDQMSIPDDAFFDMVFAQLKAALGTLISEQEKTRAKFQRELRRSKKALERFLESKKKKVQVSQLLIAIEHSLQTRVESLELQLLGVTRDLDVSKQTYNDYNELIKLLDITYPQQSPDPSGLFQNNSFRRYWMNV